MKPKAKVKVFAKAEPKPRARPAGEATIEELGADLAPLEAQMAKVRCLDEDITFPTWAAKHREFGQMLKDYLDGELPTEPGAIDDEERKCQAWLAYANSRAAEADTFAKRLTALVKLVVRVRMSSDEAESTTRAVCWRVLQEAGKWTAIAKSLQEKVWSARARMKKFEAEAKSTR